MINREDIVELFNDFPFEIDGIAFFKSINSKNIVCLYRNGEYIPIGQSYNHGYIRSSGVKTLTFKEKYTCDQSLYLVAEEMYFVLTYNKQIDPLTLELRILQILQEYDIKIKSIKEVKDVIIQEEGLTDGDYQAIKITFEFAYDYLTNCDKIELECC